MRSGSLDTRDGTVVVQGVVTDTGSRYVGMGFSSTRVTVGEYTVRFDKPFAAPPNVVITTATDNRGAPYVDVSAITPSSFGVAFRPNPTGARVDTIFGFVAMGRGRP